ncbi:hypothetical protein ACFL6S_03880 [Candidatus Poribacteria bacterium]
MNRRILGWIFGCLAMSVIIAVVTIPAGATEVKVSQLNGGQQYWWEAEDFESRDELIMLLKDDDGNPLPDLPGAFGDGYVVFKSADKTTAAEGSHFLEYKVNIPKGGKYFIWVRSSWARVAGSRDHNSFYVQVNGQPAPGALVRHVDTISDANWPDVFDQNNPWVWAGDSGKPVELQGQAGGGLMFGLEKDFVAGENTFMIYLREGDVDNSTLCTDAIMISTVDFVPTDEDYGKASIAVEPADKLATRWAELKTSK